jgi:imidazole glycerol-phosphate synthase subunit HisF
MNAAGQSSAAPVGRSGDGPCVRIISRLDIKPPNLVKGIHLEGFRVIGDPAEHAVRYYQQGADELLYVDIVASLYGRNSIIDLVERTAAQIYVPLTVGGGIRSVQDIHKLLRAGADKVAVNTAAVGNPGFITEAAKIFGSQCIVVSIEAIRRADGTWEAFTDNGREHTGLDAVAWAKRAVELGAGEILLTSVDKEGTRKGFDLDLIAAVGPRLPVPVIACGGAGAVDHVAAAVHAGADAIAVAGLLHYKMETVASLKQGLAERGIDVRL